VVWQYGGIYKLAFGPKAFIVVSDPLAAKVRMFPECSLNVP
jgi:hypothetical protein